MSETLIEVVTAEQAREVLLDLVATDPGRVDARTVNEVRPRYCAGDGPACLVAHALLALGFEQATLTQLDEEFPIGELLDNGVRLDESRNPALARLDPKVIALFAFLQDAQEAGQSWIDAFYFAYAKPSRLIPARFVKERRPWLF